MAARVVRYVLHPMCIPSEHDGEIHFIGASKLAMLYGVRMAECIVAGDDYLERIIPAGLIHLYPSRRGDYNLHEDE